jgi:hypothetical protein
VGDLGLVWNSSTVDSNQNTGYFTNAAGTKQQLGTFTASTLKLIRTGTLLKFIAPSGKHFMSTDGNKLMDGVADHPGSVEYLWAKIVSVSENGTVVADDGTGPVLINDIIPQGAKLTQIVPRIANGIQSSVQTQLVDQIFAYKTFGLRFDVNLGEWRLVSSTNLDSASSFSIGKTGDNTNQQLDASWLLLFETNGETYTITYRGSRYLFESDEEVRFYFDNSDKVYNNRTGKIIKDKISVLSINQKDPTSTPAPYTVDYDWEIVEDYRDTEGYVNSKKVQVSFFDGDDDGVVDDPDLFDVIVNETNNALQKYIFSEKVTSIDGVEEWFYKPNSVLKVITLQNKASLGSTTLYADGQIFYYVDENIFEILNKTTSNLNITQKYRAQIGRDNIKFHYVHAADESTRKIGRAHV